MSNALDVTVDNFKTEVREHPGFVLVDFWAPWCAPCRMMAPILDAIAESHKEKIKVVKINVDENSELATIYKVRGIPAFAMLKNGDVVAATVGAMNKTQFQMFVDQALQDYPV